jgi:hypothetical protein
MNAWNSFKRWNSFIFFRRRCSIFLGLWEKGISRGHWIISPDQMEKFSDNAASDRERSNRYSEVIWHERLCSNHFICADKSMRWFVSAGGNTKLTPKRQLWWFKATFSWSFLSKDTIASGFCCPFLNHFNLFSLHGTCDGSLYWIPFRNECINSEFPTSKVVSRSPVALSTLLGDRASTFNFHNSWFQRARVALQSLIVLVVI